MSESDSDRPEVSTSADVTLVARGITVTASVEVSNDRVIAVRPQGEGTAWKTSVKPGDPVELYWVAGYEERTLPAKTVGVDDDTADVVWNLAATGPAERSQRRRSVRARVEPPVSMPWSDGMLSGLTVDLSEAGMRALVDGWGLPPDNGTRTDSRWTSGPPPCTWRARSSGRPPRGPMAAVDEAPGRQREHR